MTYGDVPSTEQLHKTDLGENIQLSDSLLGHFLFSPPTQECSVDLGAEVLRNFKEIRAKFQKLDAPSLPGPVKFPEGVSQKGDTGSRQSPKTLASGKHPSSNHNEPLPSCASGDSQALKPQKVKLAQKSETQKCSNSLEPPGNSSGSSVNSQKASLLLDVNQSNAEITNKKKVMVNNSFRNKLWNWEVLSQKSKMSSVFIPASCGSRAFHLEEQKSMGLTPEEPRKKMERKGAQTLPSQRRLMSQRRLCATSEDPTVRLSQHSRRSPANPSPEKSPAGSTCHPVYDGELTSQAPAAGEEGDLPPESLGRVFSIKDLGLSMLFPSVGTYEDTPGKTQMVKVHRGRRSTLAGKQDAEIDVIQTEACPKDPKLARHSDGHWGYVKALEMTKETPGQGAFKPNSISETYDDVEYPGREGAKSDFSNSFVSDNENSEEMYEEVYRTKSNYPKIDLGGKEALKRLQRFFKKEKDRFKMKKTKSKENISDEDKLKTWKPKFLISKEKKGKNGAKESERNFFKTKKQNLEKNRMEREEKRFRERFEYDKEITVMNTAVACSNNSRNGIFDLPITPGEELEVIDITEENLVICRNSKGKYDVVRLNWV
ncbi:hypothetical protein EI555_006360 [Monodon monoceros]|uniref:FYN-binding protein 2 n=1 Tax=Monodon monoceros TaxID=40151 RepID=A0A4U1F3I6_MONMO|nr:hypothetical protein EI555_006360 [Monodon monoceros]